MVVWRKWWKFRGWTCQGARPSRGPDPSCNDEQCRTNFPRGPSKIADLAQPDGRDDGGLIGRLVQHRIGHPGHMGESVLFVARFPIGSRWPGYERAKNFTTKAEQFENAGVRRGVPADGFSIPPELSFLKNSYPCERAKTVR